MKRLCLPVFLLICMILSACGNGAQVEELEAFRAGLPDDEYLRFSSSLRCEYPERSTEFSLYCESGPAGSSVRVLKPELISGSSVSFSPEGTALNYGELSIETGSLDSYGLSPMSALPCLAEILRSAYPESSWQEGDYTVFELSLNEHLKAHVWFNNLVTVPVKAEIISDDSVKVFCSIDNWQKIME